MGLKDCSISVDSPWASYYPGQTINGFVTFTLDQPKTIRGIRIKFKGEAQTRFKDYIERRNHEGKRVRTYVDHTANEEYFGNSYYLLGDQIGGNIEIPAGSHSYPFSCPLPSDLPSSFEGEYGHIRYTIKVTLDRPLKFDQDWKTAISIISHLDLNSRSDAADPIKLHREKRFCCCWCKSAPLTIDVRIPVTGYCSGQAMPIEVLCENGSNVDLEGFTFKLIKRATFKSYHPRNTSTKFDVAISKIISEPISRNTTKTFNLSLEIPPLPPSDLLNCGIIDLEYLLHSTCVTSLCHLDVDWFTPIIIGTVPLSGFQGLPPSVDNSKNIFPNVPTPAIPASSDTPLLSNPYTTAPHPGVPYLTAPYPPTSLPAAPYPSVSYPGVSFPAAPYPADPCPSAPYPINPGPPQEGYSTAPPPYSSDPPPYSSLSANEKNEKSGKPDQANPPYPTYGQPSFRESQFTATSIHDESDNQHTRIVGGNEFAPKYLTYGFVIP